MQARVDQFKSYITDVTITSFDTTVGPQKTKYLNVNYEGPNTYVTIRYTVLPNKAEQLNKIEFILTNNTYVDENGETQEFAKINNIGILEFYNYIENKRTVTVTLRSTDGSNKRDSVIVVLNKI